MSSLGAIRQTLRELAEQAFARLERTPPLLYHNDLSASPPHFHWSAEVGYALWLRVYVEAAHRLGAEWPLAAATTEAR